MLGVELEPRSHRFLQAGDLGEILFAAGTSSRAALIRQSVSGVLSPSP
jgi:hypothetical protein